MTGLVSAGGRKRDREGAKESEREKERQGDKEVRRRMIGNVRSARISLDGLAEQMTHDENYGGLGSDTGASGSRRILRENDAHAADRSTDSTSSQYPGPDNEVKEGERSLIFGLISDFVPVGAERRLVGLDAGRSFCFYLALCAFVRLFSLFSFFADDLLESHRSHLYFSFYPCIGAYFFWVLGLC